MRDLARISSLDVVPRLLTGIAGQTSRLVKTPKLHMGDTGTCCHLMGVDVDDLKADRTLLGQLLETFVFQDVRRQASWHTRSLRLSHFRDRDGVEVDIVIEQSANTLAGIEVKASSTVTAKDFRGLKKMAIALGRRFKAGVVLYDGESVARFGECLFAVPMAALWDSGE